MHFDARPVAARGGKGGVASVAALAGGRPVEIACDLVAVSGGFSPVVHLHMQAGGGLAFDAATGAFVPATARNVQTTVGAAAGRDGLAAALADGWAAGAAAAGAETRGGRADGGRRRPGFDGRDGLSSPPPASS